MISFYKKGGSNKDQDTVQTEAQTIYEVLDSIGIDSETADAKFQELGESGDKEAMNEIITAVNAIIDNKNEETTASAAKFLQSIFKPMFKCGGKLHQLSKKLSKKKANGGTCGCSKKFQGGGGAPVNTIVVEDYNNYKNGVESNYDAYQDSLKTKYGEFMESIKKSPKLSIDELKKKLQDYKPKGEVNIAPKNAYGIPINDIHLREPLRIYGGPFTEPLPIYNGPHMIPIGQDNKIIPTFQPGGEVIARRQNRLARRQKRLQEKSDSYTTDADIANWAQQTGLDQDAVRKQFQEYWDKYRYLDHLGWRGRQDVKNQMNLWAKGMGSYGFSPELEQRISNFHNKLTGATPIAQTPVTETPVTETPVASNPITETPAPAVNPLDQYTDEQLADQVISRKYGDGDDRRNALGDRYDAVQRIVNSKMRRRTTPANGGTNTSVTTPTTPATTSSGNVDVTTPSTIVNDTSVRGDASQGYGGRTSITGGAGYFGGGYGGGSRGNVRYSSRPTYLYYNMPDDNFPGLGITYGYPTGEREQLSDPTRRVALSNGSNYGGGAR